MRRNHAAGNENLRASCARNIETQDPSRTLEEARNSCGDDEGKKKSSAYIVIKRVILLGSLATLALLILWVARDSLLPSNPVEPYHFNHPVFLNTSLVLQPSISTTQTKTSSMPYSTSNKDENAEFDAILNDLLDLHRKDEARREGGGVTFPPVDLPVLNTDDFLVASMADGGYAACVIRLIESVRGLGRWAGPVTVLVPTGEGTLPLPNSAEDRLKELGAALFTVSPETAGGTNVRGAGSATQYTKVALLTDLSFRRYKSILFLDADGLVGAPLQPLLSLHLPAGRSVAMPTWPSVEAPKETFYKREITLSALTPTNVALLRAAAPDRYLVGITAWFLIKPDLLPSPAAIRTEVDSALDKWRPSFRFNDQGLWNVIFYNTSAFYPLCLSGPTEAMTGVDAFRPLLTENLERLGDAIDIACGPGPNKRRPMYSHPLKDCVPTEEWERKKRANRELPNHERKELSKAYDAQRDRRNS